MIGRRRGWACCRLARKTTNTAMTETRKRNQRCIYLTAADGIGLSVLKPCRRNVARLQREIPMTLAAGIDGRSHRQQAPLWRRWNLGFNLITIGFCIICALFSLDVRRSARSLHQTRPARRAA